MCIIEINIKYAYKYYSKAEMTFTNKYYVEALITMKMFQNNSMINQFIFCYRYLLSIIHVFIIYIFTIIIIIIEIRDLKLNKEA